MIHEPAKWAGWQSTTAAAQHLDRLKQMQSQIYRILSARSGKPLRQIIRDTKRTDFYLDATKALEYGLIDQVLGVTHASTPFRERRRSHLAHSRRRPLPESDAAAAVEHRRPLPRPQLPSRARIAGCRGTWVATFRQEPRASRRRRTCMTRPAAAYPFRTLPGTASVSAIALGLRRRGRSSLDRSAGPLHRRRQPLHPAGDGGDGGAWFAGTGAGAGGDRLRRGARRTMPSSGVSDSPVHAPPRAVPRARPAGDRRGRRTAPGATRCGARGRRRRRRPGSEGESAPPA